LISYRVTSFILGLIIAGAIIQLIRKDLMHTRYSILWLFFAAAIAFFGIFPQVTDRIADILGVHYPPVLFITAGMGVILIKILTMDIDRSKQEQNIHKLNEKIAVLEWEQYEKAIAASTELAKTDEKSD